MGLTIVHLETAALVRSPPTGQPMSVSASLIDSAVSLVHKSTCDTARSRIDVFVVAPYSEVDVPVVKLQLHVSDGVRQVPSHGGDAFGVRVCGYGLDVEELARVELYAWEEEERCGVCVGVDRGQDRRGR